MNSRRCFRSVQILIVLCGRLWAQTAAEAGFESAVSTSPTDGDLASSATPTPGAAGAPPDSSTVASPDAATPESLTFATQATAAEPAATPQDCLCDLTPDFCDIGCCCDTVDCGIANLSTVFTGCPEKAISAACVEKWLMFRANVDSSLVTVTDSLFCVQRADSTPQPLPAPPEYPALRDSYHFSPPRPASYGHSRDFYRVDDVIQTYFSGSSVRGLLRQPSPGAAAALCINRNPARFLRSQSLSCGRMLTPLSCTADPALSARSYSQSLSLIKIPIPEATQASDLLIPVTPLSDWPAPRKENNSCINVAKKVEFVIGYTGRGEITTATLNIVLADVDANQEQILEQIHSVQFQLASPKPTSGGPVPAVGLRAGSPVIGRFSGAVKPLTTLGVSDGGGCSSDPGTRAPVLFTHNTVTGCTFSSTSSDYSELRSQIYGILQGLASPDVVAMNSGSQPDWTRVIMQECPVSLPGNCESGCNLPISLSVQVLWARQGPLELPQSYILGVKYIFHCSTLKFPMSSSLTLTTDVTFVDTTVYPEPPRGLPRPHWKFPFGFFTRGTAELDGHTVTNSGDTGRVIWSLMLLTVLLLTGLEFFRR